MFRLAPGGLRGILGCNVRPGFLSFLLLAASACVDDLQVLSPSAAPPAKLPQGPSPHLLYRLDEMSGARLHDSSGSGQLVHLDIRGTPSWQPTGLRFDGEVWAVSASPVSAFVEACRRSDALSVEVWLTPEPQTEEGMRRIVSLSSDSAQRNFTLGIGGLFSEGPLDAYTHRLRTSATNGNGLPALYAPANSVKPVLTHVVAVRDRAGRHHVYINGDLAAQRTETGDFDGWSTQFQLALGNELDNTDERRLFKGILHQVALYASALSAEDIVGHFQAGPNW